MGNQQPSLEQRKVQRLSREGVGRKRLASEVVGSTKVDEDIVCAHAERLRCEMHANGVASITY